MRTQENSYESARKRVEELKGFYTHLTVFCLVNAVLLAINLLTLPGSLWFYWPLMGWSVGLAMHAIRVFRPGSWLGADWEEKKMAELMEQGENQ